MNKCILQQQEMRRSIKLGGEGGGGDYRLKEGYPFSVVIKVKC